MPAQRLLMLSLLLSLSPCVKAQTDPLVQVLQHRHCPQCRLSDADLVHAQLNDANLRGAQLQRANLSDREAAATAVVEKKTERVTGNTHHIAACNTKPQKRFATRSESILTCASAKSMVVIGMPALARCCSAVKPVSRLPG